MKTVFFCLDTKHHHIKKKLIDVLHVDSKHNMLGRPENAQKLVDAPESDYYKNFEPYSLFIFSRDSIYRQWLIDIAEHKYFDKFILWTVVINLLFLCLETEQLADVTSTVETVCTMIYLLETIIKILAFGFVIGDTSYLRNIWDILDFIIVLTSLTKVIVVQFFLTSTNEHQKQTVLFWLSMGNVFRPLRLVALSPNLQVMLQLFVQAFPLLMNSLLLLILLYVMSGLIGLQLFKGKLHFFCQNDQTSLFDEIPNKNPTLQPNCGYRECPSGYSCVEATFNPNFSLTSFDNLGIAILTIFQVTTMEKWSYTSYRVQDAVHFWTFPYFVSLIVVGSFFIVNLTLVAIKAEMVDSEELKRRAALITETETMMANRKTVLGKSILALKNNRHSVELIRSFKHTVGKGCCTGLCHRTHALRHKIHMFCHKIINDPVFDNFFIGCIVFNTVLLMIEHHNMPPGLINFLHVSNYILTAVFLIEMILKICGLGITMYLKERYNQFDGFIATISLVEVVFESGAGVFGAARAIRIVRAFRLARVFRVMKLVRYLDTFKRLIFIINQSSKSIAYISIILLIYIFMYAMLGFQIFRNNQATASNEDQLIIDTGTGNASSLPRANFDSVFWSFVTVFQLLTLEEWINIMYDAIRGTNAFASIYFISFVLIGVYCLLNMFLAIVLQNFELDNKKRLQKRIDEKRMAQAVKLLQKKSPAVPTTKSGTTSVGDVNNSSSSNDSRRRRSTSLGARKSIAKNLAQSLLKNEDADDPVDHYDNDDDDEMSNVSSQDPVDGSRSDGSSPKRTPSQMYGRFQWKLLCSCRRSFHDPKCATFAPTDLVADVKRKSMLQVKEKHQKEIIKDQLQKGRPSTMIKNTQRQTTFQFYTKHLAEISAKLHWQNIRMAVRNGVFGYSSEKLKNMHDGYNLGSDYVVNPHIYDSHILFHFRWWRFLRHVVLSRFFQNVILILICASCVLLALDSPLNDPNDPKTKIISLVERILVFIFTAEMILKTLIMGFVGMPHSYLSSRWNVLDAAIVFSSIAALLIGTSNENLSALLTAFRVLRAFRPLRVAARTEDLRVAIIALAKSLPSMGSVMGVLALVWCIFGILSVQLFGGKFYNCSLSDISTGSGATDKEKCINLGGTWENPAFHFDNIFSAMLSLFVIVCYLILFVFFFVCID